MTINPKENELIPFNKPYMTGKEIDYINKAYLNKQFSGDGIFTNKCNSWIESLTGTRKSLLTNSCTSALEIASILANIGPGDEIILPSFTFVSSANCFILRGGIPVFVDIRKDTLNIDEKLIEQAITEKTKVILVVHYAGVSCEMDYINKIAKEYNLLVIEDSAHGICSEYKNQSLGSIGDFGTFSFHETKNIISGHGGALLINNEEYIERAEIIRDRGTNRKQFFLGQVDKYTWNDLGSSYIPGELVASFLWAQMEESNFINQSRLFIWGRYQNAFNQIMKKEIVQTPFIPSYCKHNAHIYYLIFKDVEKRNGFISYMRNKNVDCVFHYLPLHDSPYGRKICKNNVDLPVTNYISERIVRLPLWVGLEESLDLIIESVLNFST